MKKIAPLVFLSSALAASTPSAGDRAQKLFSRPLILGASVSAGYGTTDGGPSAVISRLINPNAKIDNKARSGATSVESTRNLTFSSLSPTVVLALDLFFWDAARDQYNQTFEANTRRLFQELKQKDIPLIVGKVPVGVSFPEGIKEAGKKKSTAKISNLLEELCRSENKCLLYNPVICFSKMKGPLSPEGKPYFSDRLHTTNLGNEFCAKIFVDSQVYTKLQDSLRE